MSQMPALARTDLRSAAAPARTTRRTPPPARSVRSARSAPGHLKLVTAAPRPARQMPFFVLTAIVLVAGLLALLFLNMQLAKGSYALHDLQRRSTILAEQQETLTEQLSALEAPARVASKAAELGMVPGSSPAFLRLPDGQVLGVPQTAPSLPATAKPSAKAKPNPSAKPTASSSATSSARKSASPTTAPRASSPKSTAATRSGSSGERADTADRARSESGR